VAISFHQLSRWYLEDAQGHPRPCEFAKWAQEYPDNLNNVVQVTEFVLPNDEERTRVETVFLGTTCDPSEYPPLLYGTYVTYSTWLEDVYFSATRHDAEKTHQEAVEHAQRLA